MASKIRTAAELEEALVEAMQDWLDSYDVKGKVSTFADRSLLTRDKGIVVDMANGAEFQVGITVSGRPTEDDDDLCPACGEAGYDGTCRKCRYEGGDDDE